MNIDDLLPRLDGVRKIGKGWSARCPAHPDKHPSLSIREGERGLLLHDWAGCDTEAVCQALGLTIADLFFDHDGSPQRDARPTTPRQPTLNEQEYRVWLRAMSLELHALAVLDRAKELRTDEWTPADFDAAMRAFTKARRDLVLADGLHRLAFSMRATIHERENRHAAARRASA